ncbi:hypothetical protein [Maribacter halichondriae]|uniref:hypothetical protein n=1 Tax=Maribacter halichondriae TaxID=2980554 RepID=UPI002359E7C4|nr:hypothetical protein [Maribacter sp. Hal144]
MKFFQHYVLLVVFLFTLSCRETLGEQHQNPQKEQLTSPSKKKLIEKENQRLEQPKIQEPEVKKPIEKRKPKAQDTLKPLRAIP